MDRVLILDETREDDHEATETLNIVGFSSACCVGLKAQIFHWAWHCFRCVRGLFHPQPHTLLPSTGPSKLGQISAVGGSRKTLMKL